ncbi:MAG: phosphodiester glycosidase family protein [Methylovirgula sp.]
MDHAKSDQITPISVYQLGRGSHAASRTIYRRHAELHRPFGWALLIPVFLIVSCLTLGFEPAAAAPVACRGISDGDSQYVVCTFDMRQNRRPAELRLFLAGEDGKPYGSFAALTNALKQRGETLLFGMNAGMFQTNLRPVGLYVEAHHVIRRINERGGSGNFHLKPNGVFFFGNHSAGVMETSAFAKSGLKPEYATQSGPMLVIDGAIHPKIQASGTSQKIRNGVGVRDGHLVIFAISEVPVTFYRFASLFRDRLACPNALYLDGSVSSLYLPSLGRADGLRPIGPIVGVVEKTAQE